MEPVRVALIGCGGISRAHRNGYQQLSDDVTVVACCDPRDEQATTRAGELGAEALADYRIALARPDIDAVDLCLPHDLHASVAVEAARAGKHVLVEKPIARDLAEADTMIRACADAGVVLMVGHNQRYANERRKAHDLVASGAIGDVYMMRMDHNQYVSPPEGAWRNDPEKLGGGGVADSGIHALDLLRWFCGPVKRVSAALNYNGLTLRKGEDAGIITLEHENGAISELSLSWTAHAFPWCETFFIYGTRGVIHNVGGLQMFNGTPRQGTFEPAPLDHDDGGGFREEIRHFVHCIRNGETPLTNGHEGRATLEIVKALYLSAQDGAKVALPLEG